MSLKRKDHFFLFTLIDFLLQIIFVSLITIFLIFNKDKPEETIPSKTIEMIKQVGVTKITELINTASKLVPIDRLNELTTLLKQFRSIEELKDLATLMKEVTGIEDINEVVSLLKEVENIEELKELIALQKKVKNIEELKELSDLLKAVKDIDELKLAITVYAKLGIDGVQTIIETSEDKLKSSLKNIRGVPPCFKTDDGKTNPLFTIHSNNGFYEITAITGPGEEVARVTGLSFLVGQKFSSHEITRLGMIIKSKYLNCNNAVTYYGDDNSLDSLLKIQESFNTLTRRNRVR